MHFLFLAYYHPRYMNPLKSWAKCLRAKGFDTKEMFSDKYYKEDVIKHMQLNYDAIIYFGHGIPGAWLGYNRITIKDINSMKSKYPKKTLISLSCFSMSETLRQEKSFCDHIIDNSIANCVLGYLDKIKYTSNLHFLNLLLDDFLTKECDDFSTFLSVFSKDKCSSLEIPLKLIMI